MGQEPEHCVCEISGKGGGMTAYYNEIDQHAALLAARTDQIRTYC